MTGYTVYTFIVSVSDQFQFFQEDMLIYPWWYMKKVNLKLFISCLSIWNSESWFLDMIRIYLSEFLCRCTDSIMISCLIIVLQCEDNFYDIRGLYINLLFCDFGKIDFILIFSRIQLFPSNWSLFIWRNSERYH